MQPVSIDEDFLGLEFDLDGRHAAVLIRHRLLAPGGALYGGATLALACCMMERVTDRPLVWCTTQFLNAAAAGERVDLRAEQNVSGRRTTQLRVCGSVGDRDVFSALGATGTGDRQLRTGFVTMPVVRPPDESPLVRWDFETDPDHSYFGEVEFREAAADAAPGGSESTMSLWARLIDPAPWTAARLAYVADIASTAIARAIFRATDVRRPGGSVYNSLRTGPVAEDDWILVCAHPEFVHDGYGHGTARLWTSEGVLVALADQTFALRAARTP